MNTFYTNNTQSLCIKVISEYDTHSGPGLGLSYAIKVYNIHPRLDLTDSQLRILYSRKTNGFNMYKALINVKMLGESVIWAVM